MFMAGSQSMLYSGVVFPLSGQVLTTGHCSIPGIQPLNCNAFANVLSLMLHSLFNFSKTAIAIDTIINQKKFNDGVDESKS